MSDKPLSDEDRALAEAVIGFFTSEVDLPAAARSVEPGGLWLELRRGYRYPWRIVRHTDEGATGYPCGEPFPDEQETSHEDDDDTALATTPRKLPPG